jgi:nucleoporin GLE1
MRQVTEMLTALEVTRKKEEQALHASFEARNADLWTSIEAAIQAKEQEQAALLAARKKQLEQEQTAKAEREAAIQKAQQEAAEKAEREKALKEEMDRRKAEEESKLAQLSQQSNLQSQAWTKWHEEMIKIKTEVLPAVASNADWKKLCREAKRAITPKVGQLTNSSSHIATIVRSSQSPARC